MTKFAFEMDSKFVVSLGKDATTEVDWDKLAKHPAVLAYIMRHGVKQMLGDAYSTHKGTQAEKIAVATKKLNSLYDGKAVQERGGSDPVGKLMREMATEAVVAFIKSAGKKVKDIDKTKFAKAVKLKLEANADEYRKAAEDILAMKKVEVEDVDGLMELLG